MTRIRIRRGSTADWNAYDPILDQGEPGFDVDLKVFKVGDGATAWSALPAQAGEPGEQGTPGVGVPAGGVVGQALIKASGTDYDVAWSNVSSGGGSGTVTSVNGQTGPDVVLTKSDLSLGSVDNTTDAGKPISTATQAALNAKAAISSLAAVALSGSASDITTGTLPLAVIPPLPLGATFVIASQAAMLALSASVGDMAVRTDVSKTFRLGSAPASTLGNWIEIPAQGAVSSVAGKTGNVSLVKADVGLGSVDNTADTAKPVSTAQQTALNAKAPLASPTFTGTVSGVTKAMVGLPNVDNTADTAKPVSTAQRTALNLKADTASPTFTGAVTVPSTGPSDADNIVVSKDYADNLFASVPSFSRRISSTVAKLSSTFNTTLHTDTDLNFPIGSNEAWWLEYVLEFNQPSGADAAAGAGGVDLQMKLLLPTGATLRWSAMFDWTAPQGSSTTARGALTTNTASVLNFPTLDGTRGFIIGARVMNGATAGTVNFQWAPNASVNYQLSRLAFSHVTGEQVN